jgi:hypothetical protein
MKRFKEFLTEAEAPSPSLMPTATDAPMPVTSMPNQSAVAPTQSQETPDSDETFHLLRFFGRYNKLMERIRQNFPSMPQDVYKQLERMIRSGAPIEEIINFLMKKGLWLPNLWFEFIRGYEEFLRSYILPNNPRYNLPPGVDGTQQHGPPSPPPTRHWSQDWHP